MAPGPMEDDTSGRCDDGRGDDVGGEDVGGRVPCDERWLPVSPCIGLAWMCDAKVGATDLACSIMRSTAS